MKVFISGGTGFVGLEMVRALVFRGHEVHCLVRKGSEWNLANLAEKVNIVTGDVMDIQSIDLSGYDAVIHLVAIIREFPKKGITFEKLNFESARNMIDAAQKAEVNRFILMSAIKPPPGIMKKYYVNKIKAENYLKKSDLKWTIFKPSMIYGSNSLSEKLGNIFLGIPFNIAGSLPLLGGWIKTMQPISRQNIAKAFIRAMEDDSFTGRTIIGKELFDMSDC